MFIAIVQSTVVIAATLLLFPAIMLYAQPASGQKFALVIGITGYPNFPDGYQLQYADDDARLFAAELQKPACGGFPSRNIKLLTNESATRSEIYRAINALERIVSSGDIVYFFFAGHGVVSDQGEAYLMPYDAERRLPDDRGIRATDLIQMLRQKLNYRHLVCFLDACHSGSASGDIFSFSRDGEENIIRPMRNAIIGASVSTTMGFFSCSSTEYSYEDPELQQGLFTAFLVKGMGGQADKPPSGNGDGIVTAREVYLYLLDSVSNASRRYPEQQTPEWTQHNPDFVLGETVALPPTPSPAVTQTNLAALQAKGEYQAGVAALRVERTADAVEHFRKAIDLFPEFDSAHVGLGVALMQMGKLAEAGESLRAAVAMNRDNAYAHYALGAVLLKSGATDSAKIELLKAKTMAPGKKDVYPYLGRALAIRGDLEGAASAMDTLAVLTGDADHAASSRRQADDLRAAAGYLREGRRLARADAIDDAVREFYNMIRLNQGAALAYYEIGRCYFRDDAFDKAAENLAISIQIDWRQARAHYLLGQSFDRLQRPADALERYETYLMLAPEGELAVMVRQRIQRLKHTSGS